MMDVPAKTSYSAEAYLRLEQEAEFRSEFHDGDIIPMPGGSPNHNRIAGNLYATLLSKVQDEALDIFINDLRLWIPNYRLFTYPDVMIVGEPLEFFENRRDTVTNPVMVAEVLSDSTEKYDRGDKFKMYRSVPSLQEYLLLSQTQMQVEHYVKNKQGQWLLSDYEGEEAQLELSTASFSVTLKELYARVSFDLSKDNSSEG